MTKGNPSKPNVLLITIDALRVDFLSCYGYKKSSTPNIDRLAKTGFRFTQAITGGSWTQAAFPPLLTSTYASQYGGCLGKLSSKRPSPAEILASNGYTTAGFSTNPHISATTSYDRGFHHFFDLIPSERDTKLRSIRGGQLFLRKPIFHSAMALFGKKIRPARVYNSAKEVTDTVLNWLQGAKSPFFTWMHYMDTHYPYFIEEDLVTSTEIAQAWKDLRQKKTEEQVERYRKSYEKALIYLDDQLGRLFDYIFKSGLNSNTIIIVVADHGEEFMEHGRVGHREVNLYDEIIRVPLVIKLPTKQDPKIIRRQVRTLDIMPTILDFCDCKTDGNLEGESFMGLFFGNDNTYDVKEVISERPRPHSCRIAVRTDNFKYIWDNKKPGQPELYDLLDDPNEHVNCYEKHPEMTLRFQKVVEQHLSYVDQTRSIAEEIEVEMDADLVKRLRGLGYLD